MYGNDDDDDGDENFNYWVVSMCSGKKFFYVSCGCAMVCKQKGIVEGMMRCFKDTRECP